MYSFDDTLNSMMLMPLILTASNWNLLMYRLQESEISYIAPFFFAPAVVVRVTAHRARPVRTWLTFQRLPSEWGACAQLLYMVMAPLLLAISAKILERSQEEVKSVKRSVDKYGARHVVVAARSRAYAGPGNVSWQARRTPSGTARSCTRTTPATVSWSCLPRSQA